MNKVDFIYTYLQCKGIKVSREVCEDIAIVLSLEGINDDESIKSFLDEVPQAVVDSWAAIP